MTYCFIETWIKPFGIDRFYVKSHTIPEGMTLEEAHDYYWEACYAAWKTQLIKEFYVRIKTGDTEELSDD